MQATLDSLPNEILYLILGYLSSEPPPSFTRIHTSPSLGLIRSTSRDLKSFSRVSSHFVELVRPLLFAHSCLDVDQTSEFLSFVKRFTLQKHVTSIVVTARASDLGENASWWRQLLNEMNPLRLTFLAPPTIIGQATGTELMDDHSWAFDIPYQILHLEQDPKEQQQEINNLNNCPSLLHARRWTSLCFNEASSLKAYNHYEYFRHRVPSVFDTWGNPDDTPSHLHMTPTSVRQRQQPLDAFENVTHFRYTAVFPFYNHIRIVLDVMHAIMPNLKSLTVQLAPGRNNRIIENEQRGSMDPNDPWMELATGYSLIAHVVRDIGAEGRLVRFQACDFDIEALRVNLSSIIDEVLPSSQWEHDGQGIWTKIKANSSDDYQHPQLEV